MPVPRITKEELKQRLDSPETAPTLLDVPDSSTRTSRTRTAREVVSRLLREFERRGAVERARGRIQVRDAAVLEGLRG